MRLRRLLGCIQGVQLVQGRLRICIKLSLGQRGLSLSIGLQLVGCMLGGHALVAVLDVSSAILKLNHIDGIALGRRTVALDCCLFDAGII